MAAHAPAQKFTSGTGVPSNAVGASGDWYLDSAAQSWYQKVGAAWAVKANGGSLPSVAYRLVSDGVTVAAYDKTGATVSSGTDGGAVLTACLPAAASAGATIEFRNDGHVFPWGSVPALPKGITGKLVICGNGVTVKLSAGGPRFLDFNRTADYDTFQNIEISDLLIDCNSVGGQHHIVLGTYVAGAQVMRLNLDQIAVRRVKVINVPTDSTLTNHRRGLVLGTVQATASEGTQTTVTNIIVEDYRQEGGNSGIEITGSFTGSLATGCNTFVNNIFVNRWYHDTGAIAVARFASSNVQIGGSGQLGRVYVGKGYGRGSGDIGVEIDCPREAVIEDVVIEDAFNSALYFVNYTQPAFVGENRWTARNVVNRKISTASATNRLLNAATKTTNVVALGDIYLLNCTAEQHTAEAASTTGWAVAINDDASIGCRSMTISDCLFVSDSINTGVGVTMLAVSFASATTTCRVTMRNVRIALTGAVTGGVTLILRAVQFTTGVFVFLIDGLSVDNQITGNATNAMTTLAIATSGSTTTADGTVRNMRLTASDTTVAGVTVRGTGYLTIPTGKQIMIADSDLVQAKAGSEVVLVSDTAIQTRVFQRNLAYHTTNGQPAPTTLTGLVTATGKVFGTGWPALVQFVQGSGTAITAIDISTNGGTTYTNVLTQASGAMPAGQDIIVGPVRGDSLVKVTFTTTQPTINLIPANV